MTVQQFDEILGYLITIVLPPNVSDDPPVIAEEVLHVLQWHADAVRNTMPRIETNHAAK
jgi:hypothetical protein